MRVAVIGANGQLGTDLVEALKHTEGFEPIPYTHADIEVSEYESCAKIADAHPDAVVNTAAFHRTDQCEDEPLRAFQVNAVGSLNAAKTCSKTGAVYVYISTDYVFSGEKDTPYTEDDTPSPINVYGASKLAGEKLAAAYAQKHYIVRSSGLFGKAGASGKGGNFVETIIRKAKTGEEIKVVDDVWMTPTYTKDLAETIIKILEKSPPYGVYHVANSGPCTWWQFAHQIVEDCGLDANTQVKPTTSTEYPSKAKRPKNSALTSTKLGKHGIELRDWRQALLDYLKEKGHLK